MTPSPKIVFLFTSSRDELMSRVRAGNDADTALWGLNHIPHADAIAARPYSIAQFAAVPRLLRYDAVVAQDNFILGFVVAACARLLGRTTRWFFFNMTASTLLRRHALHPVRLLLLRILWRSYARILCLSREQVEDLARFGIPRERLVFIPFGVDAAFFGRRAPVAEEDLVVSVGRDAGRDYGTLFAAATRSAYRYIVIAGRKNMPSDVPPPANVTVHFDRDRTEVRDVLARARVVAVVSKAGIVADGSDCSGQTVILDALAAGTAVVATQRSWIEDYFVPDEDLVVVPPNDPEALAGAIESLMSDAPRRARLAASGHAKVVEHYTTEAFARAVLDLVTASV